jgi:hypothetical protein
LFHPSAFSSSSLTLAWEANTENDIAGYRAYYGLTSGVYYDPIDAFDNTQITLAGFIPGDTYYFAVTAYNTAGLESDYFDEISYSIPTASPTPTPTATPTPTPDAPIITLQPIFRTVRAGQTVKFRVAATGAKPLTCQWQKNGVIIPGATRARYTIMATLEDNGALFSAIISNAFGSVVSQNATLTVNP